MKCLVVIDKSWIYFAKLLSRSPEDSFGTYIRVQLRNVRRLIIGGRLGLLIREVGQVRPMRRRGGY